MSEEKLRPCPFCGKFPIGSIEEEFFSNGPSKFHYECYHQNCIAQPKATGDTEAQARAEWNRRAPGGEGE